MNEVAWLLIIFVFLNILDGFTTWLGLYCLSPELRGREKNPVLKEDAEKSFRVAMIKKGVIVLFGVWLFWKIPNLFALRVLDLAFVFVVANNTYVFLSRRITGRRVGSPGDFLERALRRCHLSERAASIVGFYVLVTIVMLVSFLIVGALS